MVKSNIKIGFDCSNVSGGGGVFMERLKNQLLKLRCYDDSKFDVWINLCFKPIPENILELRRKNKIKIAGRFDGAYCIDFTPFLFGRSVKLLWPLINKPLNHFANRHVIKNLRLCDKAIFQSKFSKRCIDNFCGQAKNFSIVMNGIDLDNFSPIPNKDKMFKDSYPNILISHRIRPPKRVQQVPEIIMHLKKDFPEIRVHVCGEMVKDVLSDSKKAILKEVRKFNVEDNFIFYGKLHHTDLAEIYGSCDFMMFLSYSDPCPNVVIEAMACGLPVLGNNAGGLPEIVQNAGILIDEKIDDLILHWHFSAMPKVDINPYCQGVVKMLENLKSYQDKALGQVRKNHDIKIIAVHYLQACANLL